MNETTVFKIIMYALIAITVVLVAFVMLELATAKCVKTEDTCYHTKCAKGCYDVINPCDSSLTTGHQVMCVEEQHFWDSPVTISAHS